MTIIVIIFGIAFLSFPLGAWFLHIKSNKTKS